MSMLCPYCMSKGRESEVFRLLFNRCYRCFADLPTEKLLKRKFL